ATTAIYTLSLHDALPICDSPGARALFDESGPEARRRGPTSNPREDLALPLVHEASLAGIVVVVAHQVQEPMQQEQVDLQGHGDTQARGLSRGRVGRDDHLAEQPRWPV